VPVHGSLHALRQRRRCGLPSAEVAYDRKAGERLQSEPAEDQHDQPQPQGRRHDAPGDGQAMAATTRRIAEDVVAKNGGGIVLWHGTT
jgi:hypothetical protein